jgi:hypothetical protein
MRECADETLDIGADTGTPLLDLWPTVIRRRPFPEDLEDVISAMDQSVSAAGSEPGRS